MYSSAGPGVILLVDDVASLVVSYELFFMMAICHGTELAVTSPLCRLFSLAETGGVSGVVEGGHRTLPGVNSGGPRYLEAIQ
jgi:hypothetical protein